MLQSALRPQFLHIYDVDIGLWQSVTLGLPVSPRTQEAMNLILLKDGIRAYIGTRSEFTHYVVKQGKETGKDIQLSWISYPGSTIMSKLGLCLNTLKSGNPEMDFYGSPLTLALVFSMRSSNHLKMVERCSYGDYAWLAIHPDGMPSELFCSGNTRILNTSECQEALTYLNC